MAGAYGAVLRRPGKPGRELSPPARSVPPGVAARRRGAAAQLPLSRTPPRGRLRRVGKMGAAGSVSQGQLARDEREAQSAGTPLAMLSVRPTARLIST